MPTMTRSLLLGLTAGLALALLTATAAPLTGTSPASAIPAILALAVIVALMHHWKTQLFGTLRDQFRQVGQRLARLDEQVRQTQGLVQLTPYEHPYPMPFGGGWALTADAAALLAREIALNAPNTIVELGSGVSSVLIGRMLKQAGRGRLISLDHDPHWAEQTRRHIRASALEDYVQVLDAPLARQRFGEREYLWYRLPQQIEQAAEIDLLIVDGPPAALDPKACPATLPCLPSNPGSPRAPYLHRRRRPPTGASHDRTLAQGISGLRAHHV
jgi:predicted O-methyltransferase YrrM